MIEKFSRISSSDSSANGTDSGRLIRMVIGSMKLSNCAASTMYMKMIDSRKASTKLVAARPNSLRLADQAVGVSRRHVQLVDGALQLGDDVAQRLALHQVGGDQDLALAVVALDLGGAGGRHQRRDVRHRHVAERRRRDVQPLERGGRVAELLLHAELHVVAVVAFAVGGDLVVAAHQHAHGVGDRSDVHVEVGRLVAVHDAPAVRACRPRTSCRGRSRRASCASFALTCWAYLSSCCRSGPCR